jgi:hypothetical protein
VDLGAAPAPDRKHSDVEHPAVSNCSVMEQLLVDHSGDEAILILKLSFAYDAPQACYLV